MSENNTQYDNLKKEIIKKSGDSLDFQKVKDCFSYVVDSRRTLSRIKNLSDIFHVLEERDALDNNNVDALLYLGNLLANEDIINLVRGYKKLYIEDENNICSCGEDRSFIIPIVNPQRENSENKIDSLEIVMDNIAMNIGKNWRVLASELEIPECHIDEIRQKYPLDMHQQALKSLQVWKKYNEDKAILDVLKHALEARLCKMKGIGIHMMRPVITVD